MKNRDTKGQFIKGMIPWNKGMKTFNKKKYHREYYLKTRKLMDKEERLEKKKIAVEKMKQTKLRLRLYNEKGEKSGYVAKHNWVKRRKEYPKNCGWCGRKGKRIVWANVDHEYKQDINDYVGLCDKCHQKYDTLCSFEINKPEVYKSNL